MEGLVAKRYGAALFSVGLDDNNIDNIKEEVEALLEVINQDDDFMSFLSHPKINVDDKIKTVEKIFKEKINKDLMGLIVVVLKKARQDYLKEILEYFLNEYKKYNKLVTAYVISASELTDIQKDDLRTKLENQFNEKIDTIYEVDQSLIGGLIVRIGDKVIDNSIKGKLGTLNKELRKLQLNHIPFK